jgi:hypothetical protein
MQRFASRAILLSAQFSEPKGGLAKKWIQDTESGYSRWQAFPHYRIEKAHCGETDRSLYRAVASKKPQWDCQKNSTPLLVERQVRPSFIGRFNLSYH